MQGFRIGLWLAAGIAGAIVFWLFQVLTGPSTIPQFMGQQIVAQGGYSKALTIPIGWGVHLGVSLSYSLLFAVVVLIPFSRSEGVRAFVGLVIAAVLGWVTTLLTPLAITATCLLPPTRRRSMEGRPMRWSWPLARSGTICVSAWSI